MDDDVKAGSLYKRALGGHAAIGLIAGALIYLVALSGMLAVSHERFQRWEEPGAPEMQEIAPVAVQAAIENALARDGKPTEHAFVHLPTEELPRVVVTTDHGAAYVTADGAYDRPEAHAWTEFVLHLHYYLNLPMTIGIIVTGALGAMLTALAITGVLAHPRIFRDAFRLRIRGQRQLAHTDWHNRLGVWTLPFILALAVTGAMMGIGTIVFQSIADERHGGNIEEAYGPIFGDHPVADERSAPLARVDRALEWMAQNHPEHRVTYAVLDEPKTAGQQIAIIADHDRRLIYGETYQFDSDGRYTGKVGLSDGPLGRQAIASIYNLHFGNYGGLPIELAYIALGLALCAVTATGMSIWLMKRRARGLAEPRLEAFWAMVVWGSPLALVLAYWLRVGVGAQAPLAAFFWIMLAAGCMVALLHPIQRWALVLRAGLGTALAATAGAHWIIMPDQPASSLVLNAVLMLTASTLLLFSLPHKRARDRATRSAISTACPINR